MYTILKRIIVGCVIIQLYLTYVAMFTGRHMFNVAEYGMCSAILLYNILPQLEIEIHFWQPWIEIEY